MTAPLSARQATTINKSLLPTLGYLTQLERWLDWRGVLPTDEYYRKVTEARDALGQLTVETHYRSCGKGVGRSAAE